MLKWDELPGDVREAIAEHVGPVFNATPVTGGQNNDIAAALDLAERKVFIKGVCGVSKRMRWLRNEARTAPLTQGLSPEVLFFEDIGDWLIVVFEHVSGRPVSLAPESADLPLVARTVDRISTLPGAGTKPLRERWSVTDWWYKLAEEAPEDVEGWDLEEMTRWSEQFPLLADGDCLAHTDLHGAQFMVSENGSVHLIDWGYPGVGAPWVDAAFLVLRLIEAGHDPAHAEAWVDDNVKCFAKASAECRTAFAVYIAGLWGYWAVSGDISGSKGRARVARDYADRRLVKHGR